jgi:two-component system response regulator AtoC
MRQILQDLKKIAVSHASVFITGESGTGKEVIANAIHQESNRAMQPFIKVNCAAIPETLIESEFFGHEKGAFTGALNRKIGRFELADRGTLLLDEITEIPLSLQPKLLRVIQEHEFERVGGIRPLRVDVRLLATSNRNIQEAIETKVLREDLFYRLNVVPIHIPPLRERPEDILPLTHYFLDRFCKENHKSLKALTPRAAQKLLQHSWPGNVRELANIIERSVVLDFEEEIDDEHLYLDPSPPAKASVRGPCLIWPEQEAPSPHKSDHCHTNTAESPSQPPLHQGSLPVGLSLHELERRLILETLAAQHYNRTKTAAILKISVRTLRNKLRQYTTRDGKSSLPCGE